MANCCHCFQQCGQPHISCDSCKMPMHNRCLDLSENELRVITASKSTHLKVFCNRCKATLNLMNEMKAMISDLQTSIDARLCNVEKLLNTGSINLELKEEIIQESVQRALRASNVVLFNVPENPNIQDVDSANDILECIDESVVVYPDDVLRIGKLIPNKPRPLKLSFKKPETAKLVLRKSAALKNTQHRNIYINSDKTQSQQQYYRNLKEELNARKSNGEPNLVIKYVNDIPKIVQKSSSSMPNNITLN